MARLKIKTAVEAKHTVQTREEKYQKYMSHLVRGRLNRVYYEIRVGSQRIVTKDNPDGLYTLEETPTILMRLAQKGKVGICKLV